MPFPLRHTWRSDRKVTVAALLFLLQFVRRMSSGQIMGAKLVNHTAIETMRLSR